MSKLTEFYLNDGVDCEGRTFNDLLAWSDEKIEAGHDFIQWLFPKVEPSNYNPDAPIPTLEDIKILTNDPVFKNRMRLAFTRFLKFLGFKFNQEYTEIIADYKNGEIVIDPKHQNMWKIPNHNWLRVTRVLISLRTFGLQDESERFFEILDDLVHAGYWSKNSHSHWLKAMDMLVNQ